MGFDDDTIYSSPALINPIQPFQGCDPNYILPRIYNRGYSNTSPSGLKKITKRRCKKFSRQGLEFKTVWKLWQTQTHMCFGSLPHRNRSLLHLTFFLMRLARTGVGRFACGRMVLKVGKMFYQSISLQGKEIDLPNA